MVRRWRGLWRLVAALWAAAAAAAAAPFDLAGPGLTVTVTHAGVTLPIAQTPNLTAGDSLSIKADLPPGQSVRYLLVATFLRGATNPPPMSWFSESETWTSKGQNGLQITVPKGAEQLLIFFAPETGGDFKTLTSAVRGRPGAFVRASQDLNQASLDRARLDAFLTALRRIDQQDPDQLKTVSPLLARSLTIKLNNDCLQKMAELQAACLMQGPDSLVLDDGHGTSLVQTLTTGDPASLTQQLSGTPQAGSGYYSPYIGAAIDIARIMDSFHTAQYQYIPALAVAKGDQLSLVLNTAPSFHTPMSVLVAALPAIAAPEAPPLEPVDPKAAYCAEKPGLVLPVEGAPLVFSTDYARNLVLRLKREDGASVDLPATADAQAGGLRVDNAHLDPARLTGAIDASLHGDWGFEPFEGPKFLVQASQPTTWRLAADDRQSLIIGRDDTVRLNAPQAACVEAISLRQPSGQTEPVVWKLTAPDEVQVTLPLKDAQAGGVTLLIKQFGLADPDAAPLEVFAQTGLLDHFDFHVGELTVVLKGVRLDEVKGLTLGGAQFRPAALTTSHGTDTLTMVTSDPQAAALKAGDQLQAKVMLNDGRTTSLKVAIGPRRPNISLISKSVSPGAAGAGPHIELGDKNDLPQGAALAFSIAAHDPTQFSDRDTVDIAGADGRVLTTLSLASGLVLEDAHVLVATLDTSKALNASVYGPLQFRLVDGGDEGDWQPLATLVRLPDIRQVKCRGAGRAEGCVLSGSSLFLINAVAGDAAFDHPFEVPEGFTGFDLSVPRPHGARLFLKLHDDPTTIDSLVWGGDGVAGADTAHPARAAKPAAP